MNASGAAAAPVHTEEPVMLQGEIGTVAGAIWRELASNGACTISKLQKQIQGKAPVFDWAIGWLARAEKIVITREKRAIVVCLKET